MERTCAAMFIKRFATRRRPRLSCASLKHFATSPRCFCIAHAAIGDASGRTMPVNRPRIARAVNASEPNLSV
jgi:hypothetical protein